MQGIPQLPLILTGEASILDIPYKRLSYSCQSVNIRHQFLLCRCLMMIDLNMLMATPPQALQRVEGSSGLTIQRRIAKVMIGSEEFRESVASGERFSPLSDRLAWF